MPNEHGGFAAAPAPAEPRLVEPDDSYGEVPPVVRGPAASSRKRVEDDTTCEAQELAEFGSQVGHSD